MRRTIFRLIFLAAVCAFGPSLALQIWPIDGPHWLYVGPECYHLKRIREGGTTQDGMLCGGRIGYDRIRPCAWYWGIDSYWAQGTLHGSSGKGTALRSIMTDVNVEGRLGYTFWSRRVPKLSLSLFTGAGYFNEDNRYISPSPMHLAFRTHFTYVLTGFLSRYWFRPCLAAGVDFKVRYLMDGWHKISGDKDAPPTTVMFRFKRHYVVDVPLIYVVGQRQFVFGVALIPFYRFRHYGGRENHPFDFFDTRIHDIGARVLFSAWF